MNKLNTVEKVKIIKFQTIISRDANIDIFNEVNNFFKIKRIFTVKGQFNKKNNNRGFHAHKNCEQIITCPNGIIKFKVFDGKNSRNFIIKNNNKAIYVPNHIWTETKYLEKNTTLVCYCSNKYDEKSYIRDISEFKIFRKLNLE